MAREWFAIRTKPHKEFVAELNLCRQNLVVYLPQVVKTRRHARRVEKVSRPFFPGYLFLHLAPEEQIWPTIASTRGVLAPVQFGEYFPAVPEAIIETLKNREDDQGKIHMEFPEPWLKPGKKVRVKCGGLDDIEGLFQQVTGEDRALILVDMLRRQVPVAVPISSLYAA